MHQDGAGLEHADRLRAAAVDECRDLGVGVDGDEAAAELVAFADLDQPGVVFSALVAEGEQFLEHHSDLHAIRRAERIELQRMAADRQFLFVRGAGGRTIGVGKPPESRLADPDLRWGVLGRIGHVARSRCLADSVALQHSSCKPRCPASTWRSMVTPIAPAVRCARVSPAACSARARRHGPRRRWCRCRHPGRPPACRSPPIAR